MKHHLFTQRMSKAPGWFRHIAITAFFICMSCIGRAQSAPEADPPKYFAQCLLNVEDKAEFIRIEAGLRENPYISVVRLDWSTKRLFLLTKDVDTFGKEQFISWLGYQAEKASCIQVGLHGSDPVNPYPFTNCEN